MALQITRVAAVQLLQTMAHHGVRYMRFGAKSGGCNGLQYELTPIVLPEERATLVPVDEHHAVELCMKSELFLFGTLIDWREDLMGKRFVFTNPNAAASCGCGSTFSV